MLELAEGEEQRDVGQAVPGHYHHPHHTQREGRSALVLCRNGFGGGLGRPAAANGQEGLTQYIAALQLPYVYLPFPFSGKPVSSQYLDILLSYWPGLSLVPLSCLIPSCAAVASSTGPFGIRSSLCVWKRAGLYFHWQENKQNKIYLFFYSSIMDLLHGFSRVVILNISIIFCSASYGWQWFLSRTTDFRLLN